MKKFNILHSTLVRILPIIVAVVVMVSALSVPASAAVLDYRDYIVDIVVEGDKDLVTLYIPSSMAYWELVSTSGTESYPWIGGGAVWHDGRVHHVRFYPLGKGNVFTLDDFPDGTEVTFGIYISSHTQVLYSATDLYMVYPFSSEFGIIDTDGSGTNILFDYTFVIDRQYGNGTFYARADIDFVSSLGGGHVEYTTGPTTVTFSISSAYRDYIENGKNKELMEEIEKQLDEQGKQLDQIINGTVDPVDPPGSSAVDNIGKVEDNLMSGAVAGMGEVNSIFTTAINMFTAYGGAFLCVATMLNKLTGISFVNDLVMISFALGVFCTLLGVGVDTAKSGGSKATKKTSKSTTQKAKEG